MIKKNQNYKRLQKNITFSIFSKFILALVVYCAIIFTVYFLGQALCSTVYWRGDEALFKVLKTIERNETQILFFLFIIGFVLLFAYFWNKTLGYLRTIVLATENIYSSQDDLVTLPEELKDVENQMNQIKLNIRESQRVAKEAEQRKNDLIVYLAHDLKTPLTSVIGYLTLLRDEQQISAELRKKYLSISLDKAERLEDLINEFFEITRFNLSHITLEHGRVNLTRMLEQLIYEFKPMFSEKDLQYILNAEPDIMIRCDVDKMQRVFDNLLRNAVNYSFEKSAIIISVKTSRESIKLSFINQGNTISEEKLGHMFEQFYRLDTARSTKSGGAGLGLAIAKEIVELHGGSITAESSDDTISFEIILPRS